MSNFSFFDFSTDIVERVTGSKINYKKRNNFSKIKNDFNFFKEYVQQLNGQIKAIDTECQVQSMAFKKKKQLIVKLRGFCLP